MKKRILAVIDHPVFLTASAPFFLMSPIILGGKALFWGTQITQFVPWWVYAWESLLEGHLPLWNPLVGMGAPLLANYQTALLYPPTWIYLFLYGMGGLSLMAWGLAVVVAAHLAWAGVGMAVLAHRLGWGALAQTVCGLAFGMSGYLVGRTHFLSINAAVAWLPWILLAGYDLAHVEKTTPKNIVGLAFFLAMQLLAGHAQTTWYTVLLLVVWVAFWAWQRGKGRGWRTGWLALATAGLLSAGMAAIQLIPTAEYLIQSHRSVEVGYEWAMTNSFWPWRFLTLFLPNLFGNPAQGDYWGYATYWEDATYIGVLGVILALMALVRRKEDPREKKLTWFLMSIILVSIILALGKNTPVFPWLFNHIPTFDMFQAPARYLIWAEFGLVLLAGLGVEKWRRPEEWSLYWSRLGVAGAFAVSLGAGLGWYAVSSGKLYFGEIKPTFVPAFAIFGLFAMGVGGLNLLAPPKDEPVASPLWRWAVQILLAVDLLIAGWGLNPGGRLELYQTGNPAAEEVRTLAAGGRVYLTENVTQELKYEHFFRFDTFDIEAPWLAVRAASIPNVNMLDGIAVANNFDPLLPGRYQTWMNALAATDAYTAGKMLVLMDVTVVGDITASESFDVEYTPVEGAARARFVTCVRTAGNGEEAWEHLFTEDRLVVLEETLIAKTVGEDCQEQDVEIIAERPNEVVLSIPALDNGFVVLSDTWYPGWVATVDGVSALVLHANYLFRAVAVPAGEHEVRFIYRPISFYGGALLTLIAWAIWGILWLRARKIHAE